MGSFTVMRCDGSANADSAVEANEYAAGASRAAMLQLFVLRDG